MDRLKSVLAAKKKETTEKFGEKKFLKRAELEAQKAKRPREQGGAQENVEEESSKKSRAENADAPSPSGRSEDQETKTCVEDVVRRLRKIGQPKTLFGETDEDRLRRLLKCEAEMVVDELDDHGVTGKNVLKVIEEEEEAMRKQMAMQKAGQEGDEESMPPPEPVDPVKAAFERAARKLRDQKSDELPPDDKVLYWLDRWCQEWKEDLDARDVAAKETSRGKHATNLYKTSMIYFRPLREELEQRTLKQDVLIGLIIMVDAMRDRNYRDAMDAYIKICIGNAAWPIGVTQVGIQRMASRDKIKEVNAGKTSSAHIMSDEATRKWLQAWKRLMSVVQRVHPTDPSRAVDFGAREDAGWGAKGRGSVKAAFQEAKLTEAEELERAKDKVKVLQNEKGEVLIPEKLSFTLKKGQEWLKNRDIGPQPQ